MQPLHDAAALTQPPAYHILRIPIIPFTVTVVVKSSLSLSWQGFAQPFRMRLPGSCYELCGSCSRLAPPAQLVPRRFVWLLVACCCACPLCGIKSCREILQYVQIAVWFETSCTAISFHTACMQPGAIVPLGYTSAHCKFLDIHTGRPWR